MKAVKDMTRQERIKALNEHTAKLGNKLGGHGDQALSTELINSLTDWEGKCTVCGEYMIVSPQVSCGCQKENH